MIFANAALGLSCALAGGLRVFMAQLRRKIESDPNRPRLLVTEPGVGYRLRDVEPAGES